MKIRIAYMKKLLAVILLFASVDSFSQGINFNNIPLSLANCDTCKVLVAVRGVTKRVSANLINKTRIDSIISKLPGGAGGKQTQFITNVKDYGALGNGEANDSAAVAQALANVPDYGTLMFPAGVYRCELTIRRNNISIIGFGSASTVIKTRDGKNAASVIELGNLAAGNSATSYKNIQISGLTLNGNSSLVPAPDDDLHGWGLSATKISSSTFKDVSAINCPSGGAGFFINSNYNKGDFYVARSGYTNTYNAEPGFDINSSKYNHFTVTSDSCAYGARVLDNCFDNQLNYIIRNAKFTGLVITNQAVNKSYGNTITASINGGCQDQAVVIGPKTFSNNFNFVVSNVLATGVNEIDSSYTSRDTSILAHDNNYSITTQNVPLYGTRIGGRNGNWKISSYNDGHGGGLGDYFGVFVTGSKNRINATVTDDSIKTRGILFYNGSRYNNLIGYSGDGTLTDIDDVGVGNVIIGTSLGVALPSTSVLSIPPLNGSIFTITGTTSITDIVYAELNKGRTINLKFLNPILIGNSFHVKLLTPITTTANQVLTLISDGINWYPIGPQSVPVISTVSTLDFPSISAQSEQSLTVTATGAAVNDLVSWSIPTASVVAGVIYTARISSANTITITAFNITASAVDPASGVFNFKVTKP